MSGDASRAFDPRVIAGLIVAGIVGFAGYALMSAFAADLGTNRDGGGHALSRSAAGFSGIVELARAAGLRPEVLRGSNHDDGLTRRSTLGLLILTPSIGTAPQALADRIVDYAGPVLVVLPKHVTSPDPAHRGWVRSAGRAPEADGVLPRDVWRIRPNLRSSGLTAGTPIALSIDGAKPIAALVPDQMPLLDGKGLVPVAAIDDGALIASPDAQRNIFILTDPDLLNNRAIGDPARATTALAIVRALDRDGGAIGFDITLNGLGSGDRSLLRLALTPPFLGLTLCLVAASLLALWQGFVRFGPPWREGRVVALGKAALVANGAQLIVQARRLPNFAPRYVAMIRDIAARRLHAPPGIVGVALDRWLDRFTDGSGRRFSALVSNLDAARTPDAIVRQAAALGQWRRDVVRDSD